MSKRACTLVVGAAAVAVVAATVLLYGRDVARLYYIHRFSTDREFFAQTVEKNQDRGLRNAALSEYLQLDEGKEALFRLFYEAVVEKYPWLPQRFDIGLHGVMQFGPDGKIAWTMRIPGNANWNNQDPTPRLRAIRPYLDSIQRLEFRLDEHQGWRFILCGDSPVEVYREMLVHESACVLIGPRTPYPDLFCEWIRKNAFRPIGNAANVVGERP